MAFSSSLWQGAFAGSRAEDRRSRLSWGLSPPAPAVAWGRSSESRTTRLRSVTSLSVFSSFAIILVPFLNQRLLHFHDRVQSLSNPSQYVRKPNPWLLESWPAATAP